MFKSLSFGIFPAIILYSLAHMMVFQWPVMAVILANINLGESSGTLLFASTQILQFFLMMVLLSLLSVVSVRLMKGFMALNAVINAAAFYYMNTYSVVLDQTMIGNILNTDQSEAAGLWHPSILLYVLPALGFALWLLLRVQLRPLRWWRRGVGFLGSLTVLLAWAFATPATWFWYDQHGEALGSRLLPWNYLVNTARYFNHQALANREQILLADAQFAAPVPAGQKDVVILVIGEAARADHFSNYGYDKRTNPYTPDSGIVVQPMGKSCATYTIAGLACMLTHEGNAASPRTVFEPIQSYLTRHGVYTEFRSNNFGEPPIKVDAYLDAKEIAAACDGPTCPNPNLDEALFWRLRDTIETAQADRIFLTLHQSGSHGPAYFAKYTKEFERFTPVCDTVKVSDCTAEELSNAYDNTLVYNDYLLAELVREMNAIPNARVAMIYTSDHGQSLGENGLYLHGAPIAVAPDEQRVIPFYVWMSDSFKQARNLTNADILRDQITPHDLVFHSIMGAFGMTSDIYIPQRDLFNITP